MSYIVDSNCVPEAEVVGVGYDGDDPSPKLIVLRVDGQVRAYLNVCPHAGLPLDYAPGRFLVTPAGRLVCPAHGATFERTTGLCVAGPCRGQSLRALATVEVEGQITITDVD